MAAWHPLKDSNLGMSESKSDALDQLGEEGVNGSFTVTRTQDPRLIKTVL